MQLKIVDTISYQKIISKFIITADSFAMLLGVNYNIDMTHTTC
jgi:hypothetical protein